MCENAVATLVSLHREYECWCDVCKFCGAPELRKIKEAADGRKKHLRIMMVAQAKAICESAAEYRKTGGLKSWAMRGDISDAFRTLGLWLKEDGNEVHREGGRQDRPGDGVRGESPTAL